MKKGNLLVIFTAVAVAVVGMNQAFAYPATVNVMEAQQKMVSNLNFCMKYPSGTSSVTSMVNNKPVTSKVPCKPIKINPKALKVISQ